MLNFFTTHQRENAFFFEFTAQKFGSFKISSYLYNGKIAGLQNTASDCSSGGKGSEVLFLVCIRDVVRNSLISAVIIIFGFVMSFISNAKVQLLLLNKKQ